MKGSVSKGTSEILSTALNLRDDDIREILSTNKGFDDPQQWIDYARLHGFKVVEARHLLECPECGSRSSRVLGQFVYYSQLSRLRKCRKCKLIYSDVVVDSTVIQNHFESAYKDVAYFQRRQRTIFNHIVEIVEENCRDRSSVIDIGGGMGHLASLIRPRRPDCEITFSDISQRSCEHASSFFEINSVCCALENLWQEGRRYDTLLMVDVLYYVQDLPGAWRSILACSSSDAELILRIPNKIWWIELRQFFRRHMPSAKMMDRIVGMNPEHLYVFSHSYLKRKLKELGFKSVKFIPSPFTDSSNPIKSRLLRVVYLASVSIHAATLGLCCLTPSQIVIARRK